ncbi:hypothetical protein ADMFC3_08820 [Geovibrio sp. ADMFC3]
MENRKKYALTSYIKEKGYGSSIGLNNWIAGILKNKEDFRKYIVEHEHYGRREKIEIYKDAEILIDNLCLLKPYLSIFGKGENKEFPAYRGLKNQSNSKQYIDKLKERKSFLKDEIESRNQALENYEFLYEILEKHLPIDLEGQSLLNLINDIKAQTPEGKTIKFDNNNINSFSVLDELLELKGKLENEDKSKASSIYRKMALCYIKLSEVDDALEVLDTALNMNPKDSDAWALKAKIIFQLLTSANKELSSTIARTEYSGPEEFPITSEEQNISDLFYTQITEFEQLGIIFIETCINALLNWYSHNGSIPLVSNEDIKFEWLIINLISTLTQTTTEKYQKEIQIIFSRYLKNSNIYLRSPFFDKNQKIIYEVNLVRVLSWLSKNELQEYIHHLTGKPEDFNFHHGYTYNFITHPKIKKYFIEHLGIQEYKKLYKELWGVENAKRTAEHIRELIILETQDFKNFNNSQNDIKSFIDQMSLKYNNFDEFTKNEAWHIFPFSEYFHTDVYLFLFTASLLALISGNATASAIKMVEDFSQHKDILKDIASNANSIAAYEITKILVYHLDPNGRSERNISYSEPIIDTEFEFTEGKGKPIPYDAPNYFKQFVHTIPDIYEANFDNDISEEYESIINNYKTQISLYSRKKACHCDTIKIIETLNTFLKMKIEADQIKYGDYLDCY